jgi:acetate kinase
LNILIFNCGSSSQAFKVYQVAGDAQAEVVVSGKAKNVATKTRADAVVDWVIQGISGSKVTDLSSHSLACREILAVLKDHSIEIDAVGHRFVHGGTLFDRSVKIDPQTMKDLKKCLPFAPLHNPNSYSVIEVCQEQLPGVPQFAVFDTSFHSQMPEESRRYALPKELVEKFGFRKYGFHGLSYQFVSAKAAELLGKPLESLKLILCHLGTGGSSVVAVKDGKSLDTSMGFTPLPGLVMSTRCGDLDPEIALEMVRQGNSPDEVSSILNNQSGLVGLSGGFSSNLAEIIEEAAKGNQDCQIAYDVYAHRLSFYIGAFDWLLNSADAIIFTDSIGVKSWKLRERVCSGVENMGLLLNKDANEHAFADQASRISLPESRIQIWVVPTDEESIILKEVVALM